MKSHAPAVAGKPDPKKGPYQATPWNIQLSATDTPGFTHVENLEQRSADRASDLVMNNHSKFHTFHDEIVGFHNHISHHVLTLWALGATPDEMQAAYDFNKPFQLLTYYNDPSVNIKLRDPEFFRQGLGNFELYGDYVRFFQAEVAAKGVQTVLNDYLFKRDTLAEDLLARLYSGFLHPFINLGFALEFQQPFLAAECLASTCMHPPYPAEFLTATEQHVECNGRPRSLPILSIVEGMRLDPVVATAVGPEDGNNRIADALLKRALKELIPHLSHFQVERTEEDLARKTAEILQASAYICGAAQHPRKVEALDFVMLHSLTAAVFLPTIIRQEWISIETRARLLEWKGRSDLITYAALGCPKLYPDRITRYRPKQAATGWSDVVQRAGVYQDDGHTCKVIRALMCAEDVCQPFEGDEGFPLKKADFLTLAHMTMDSVERMLDPNWVRQTEKVKQMSAQGRGQHSQVSAIMLRWVRWCGTEGAWDDFPDLDELPPSA
ncbi:oxidoreductase AflY [Aspergillus sergii]|uniref:Oxidoreductase AflY n=1 Tax=Aspergillus sergii TaxID=1034303 RepID=A0A5N6WWA1_9EURO|nr:oxidoreductase AflY [Aspergillus sergii]